jgi:hypothetical protein
VITKGGADGAFVQGSALPAHSLGLRCGESVPNQGLKAVIAFVVITLTLKPIRAKAKVTAYERLANADYDVIAPDATEGQEHAKNCHLTCRW